MRSHPTPAERSPFFWFNSAVEYSTDRWQRAILFLDVMRQRGNNYFDHLRAGQPPVVIFDYETILDGRKFDPPANYALVKIKERRDAVTDRRRKSRTVQSRRQGLPADARCPKHGPIRPLVVIVPRAGHGPGIGGSKLDSQIGVALDYGYPVYFIMFYPDPEPGQTVAAVQQAEISFLEEVVRRHADAPKPAVIGNCQAGWAAALIGADRPDLVGPMVLNGSPLSYWGGVEGANPMRYKGGLSGGIWSTAFWSDIGNGQFDGAHLVAGFEDLNPANTYWTKAYRLFSKVDTEAERFLNFEKWWGGFFKLSAKEIRFITRALFVGNELEQGLLELEEGQPINLKNFKDPIFVFASSGDNITPPPQALNWIVKVYGSVEEIKRHGQIIVYMVHEDIGHLGIFVSGRVAAKEHREIISCLEMVEYLVPGLYEMVITDKAGNPDVGDYGVQFEVRDISDILALDDGLDDEKAFVPVAEVSKLNDAAYRQWVQPWVRLMTNPWLAEYSRQLHPLRVQRYGWSDLNPYSWPLAAWSAEVKTNRLPATPNNPFVAMEETFSRLTTLGLNYYRDIRDQAQEVLFKSIYDNPWARFWLGGDPVPEDDVQTARSQQAARRHEQAFARRHVDQGGFAEAVLRIIIAVAGVDLILDKRQLEAAGAIVGRHARYENITPKQIKQMVHGQSRILSADFGRALEGLPVMLPSRRDRMDAFDIAIKIAVADSRVDICERKLLTHIRNVLGLDHNDRQAG